MILCSAGPAARSTAQAGSTTARPRPPTRLSFGTCFVTCGIVVRLPFCTRPVCPPVLARLVLPGKHQGPGPGQEEEEGRPTPRHARYRPPPSWSPCSPPRSPAAPIDVVADAAYHGPALKHLPPSRDLDLPRCAPTRSCTAWRRPVPRAPRAGPAARASGWAPPASSPPPPRWAPATVRTYRRRPATSTWHDITCLWYGCLAHPHRPGHPRPRHDTGTTSPWSPPTWPPAPPP